MNTLLRAAQNDATVAMQQPCRTARSSSLQRKPAMDSATVLCTAQNDRGKVAPHPAQNDRGRQPAQKDRTVAAKQPMSCCTGPALREVAGSQHPTG